MFQSTNSMKIAHYSILVMLAILLLVMALYADRQLLNNYKQEQFSKTQDQLQNYHNRIYTNLQSHIQTVRGLPGLFAVNPHLTQTQFELGVKHLINSQSVITNIAAAPNMVIRYMYPIKGNEEAIGLDYRSRPSQFEAAERARTTGNLVLAGPVNLVQGGVGLITRIPVFLEDEHGKTSFWGLISAVIDMDAFLKQSGLTDDTMPIKLAIRGKDGLGRQGDVFYGDPQLFTNPRLLQTLKLPEGEWILTAEPLDGWGSLPVAIWQQRILFFVLAVAMFFLLALFLRFIFKASLANIKFRNLIESSPVPYLLLSRVNEVLYVNKAFSEHYGYSVDELAVMKNWWDITTSPVKNQQQFEQLTFNRKGTRSAEQAADSPMEVKLSTKARQQRVALISASSLSETLENEVLILVYDITVRKEAEEQLRFSSRVFNQAQEGIIITTTDGAISDVNPAFCEITGYSREEVIGRQPDFLRSGKHSPEFFNKLWHAVKEHGYWQGEVWNRRKNGELYAELLTISALTDEDGESRHYVGLFSDITQSKQQQETLELIAHYDVLTKLPNRVLFADRFEQAVAHSRRTDTILAICFLDLDGFKPVNDNYGHNVGDQLLIEVAKRLRESVRDEDTISRFGGDEFAIIFRDVDSEKACEQLLERLHRSLAQPYQLNGDVISISASSGVTFYPSDNADLDTLLRHADQTMYEAKLAGRNTFKLFNPAHNLQTIERQHRLDEIGQALEKEQLTLYFQPKVNMRSGTVFGMEALIRWNHPVRGVLSPALFLPSIEGTQLEIEIGKWVISTALQQLDNWHKQGFEIEVSVNIATSHLQSGRFINDVGVALEKYPDVLARYLQLEVLETTALGDLSAISKVIKMARDLLGVSVALDDFGTGYSSLTHLRHLTATSIKIDQSFVRDMLDDPQDFTIVDGVTGLAEAFNRQVIAEGVETNEHGLMLLLIGCDRAQGYGIARPMPAENVIDWLKAYQPNQQWLAVAAEPLSEVQRSLRLYSLTAQYWYSSFLNSINEDPEKVQHWPLMGAKKCHCGSWIARVQSQAMFNPVWLSQLNKVHDSYHSHAAEMRDIYLAGDPQKARAMLPQLTVFYDEMMAKLNGVEAPLPADSTNDKSGR